MSEPKKGSFAAIGAARLAGFISYREAVTKLAEHTGDSYNDVAAELKAAGFYARSTVYVSGDERALDPHSGDHNSISELLNLTIRTGALVPDWTESKAHNPDRSGWVRAHFIEALVERGLPCPDSLTKPPPYTPRTTKPATAKPRPKAPADDDELLQSLELTKAGNKELHQQLEGARQEIERLEAERPDVEGRLRPMIVAVGRQFWSDGDSVKRRPKAEEITGWIRETYPELSEAEAACVERAACPVDRDRDQKRKKAADAAKDSDAGTVTP